MFGFFTTMFGRHAKKPVSQDARRPRQRQRLNLEELMPRVLPSVNHFSLAWGHYAESATHPAFAAFVTGAIDNNPEPGDGAE